MNVITKSVQLPDGRTITIETGKVAKQADGAAVLRMGNTVLLATVCAAKDAVPGTDFMPLQVDYREQYSAAGRFPGGFTKRIMMLRELYNKYHAAGFEIYQVSVDPDEHFWKTSTAALPWISVRDEDGIQGASVAKYNVQSIPTFFLIDRSNTLRSRDVQIKDLDAAINALL